LKTFVFGSLVPYVWDQWTTGVGQCVPAQNLGGAQNVWFYSRITLFCLEKRLSKRKITIFFKHLGGHDPFGTLWLRLWCGSIRNPAMFRCNTANSSKNRIFSILQDISLEYNLYNLAICNERMWVRKWSRIRCNLTTEVRIELLPRVGCHKLQP